MRRETWAVLFALAALVLISTLAVTLAAGRCVWQGRCTSRIVLGENMCHYCDPQSGFNLRDWCCPSPVENCTCFYDGNLTCVNADLMVGMRSGPAGTCGSCTAPNFIQDGKCQEIVDGVGDSCDDC
jgi:hypothetical protein